MVTAYPHEQRRIANLLHHKLPYDKLTCGAHDKITHIQNREREGAQVVAIFEDGPHNLDKYLPHNGVNYGHHIIGIT